MEKVFLFDREIVARNLDEDELEELRKLSKELRKIQKEMIDGIPVEEYKSKSLGTFNK